MSKRLPPLLTDRLNELLNGARLEEQLNKVLLLVTLDEAGWPYVAMLSYLEVIAADRSNLRIAPWNNSTTTANLRRERKATLIIVDEEMAYYIQTTAEEISRDLDGFPGMAKINLRIESILEDKALDYEGAARVTTGIRFENPQMDAAYRERGRQVLDALRR
ncbi:MAG: pyridoxamine 5'-phosphate oxidase family protein [Acidobacteria bacterium]|nr:pyridoxamine 5'-phosphate oxidase family protein [Acidobacteriota bacterium]